MLTQNERIALETFYSAYNPDQTFDWNLLSQSDRFAGGVHGMAVHCRNLLDRLNAAQPCQAGPVRHYPVTLSAGQALELLAKLDDDHPGTTVATPWNLICDSVPGQAASLTVHIDGVETVHQVRLKVDGTWLMTTSVEV